MKMNKTMKIASVIAAALLIAALFCVIPVSANGGSKPASVYIDDELGLLTDTQRNRLSQRLKEISDQYNMDFMVITREKVGDYDDERIDYADLYQEQFRPSGVLFMYEEYSTYKYIATQGDGFKALSDRAIDLMLDDICAEYDGHGNYDFEGAVNAFIDGCVKYCGYYAENGKEYREPKTYPLVRNIIISSLIALLAAAIAHSREKKRLQSVQQAMYAGDYVVPNSLNVYGGSDLYLYSTVSRVRRESSSSSSGGGGHSSHSSSSGGSHGGGGRH